MTRLYAVLIGMSCLMIPRGVIGAGEEAAIKAELDMRRFKVDALVEEEKNRNPSLNERIMTRSQVRELLDELEHEVSRIKCPSKKECGRLAEILTTMKANVRGVKTHPYSLSHNTALLVAMNSTHYLAAIFAAADARTISSLGQLIIKASDHVMGLSMVFEDEILDLPN